MFRATKIQHLFEKGDAKPSFVSHTEEATKKKRIFADEITQKTVEMDAKKLLGTLFLFCGLNTMAQTYTNPVFNSDTPDPTVQRAPDGTFWCYATGCKTRKSKDLMKWSTVNDVFTRPTWNDTTVVENGQKVKKNYSVWACDCNYVDGTYIMYYALALWGNTTRTGIGVATGTRPDKMKDVGRMFRSTEIGVTNSIDPCFVEEFDKKYLVWGSFHDLYITELSSDGLKVKNFQKKTKLAGGAFEGVMIYKRGKYYYMFASVGSCCEGVNSTYRTVVGRSTSLMGPFVNKQGGKMYDNNYTTIIKGNDRWKGPGHNSEIITDDNGDDWIMYHAYDAKDDSKGRVLLLDKIVWGKDDWPTVGDGTPSTTPQQGPVFYSGDGANLTYRFANMDMGRSDFKGWDSMADNCSIFKSGQGTAFLPICFVRGGSFDIHQTRSGLSNGLYEFRLDNFSNKEHVEIYANDCSAPVNQSARCSIQTDSNSDQLLTGNFSQSVYGLVLDGTLTIGMRSTKDFGGTERYSAGNLKVIYREDNATACQSVFEQYRPKAEKAIASTSTFYNGHRNTLKENIATFEASEDKVERYNCLLTIVETLKNIDKSTALYDSLKTLQTPLLEEINYAKTIAHSTQEGEALYNEISETLAQCQYDDKQVEELIGKINQSIHDLSYTFQAGDGTRENPYLIVRPQQLDHMHEVPSDCQITYFRLGADIDMQGYEWSPLNSTQVKQHYWMDFDGDGHIIQNLFIHEESGYASFFGSLCGTCRNVGFVNAKVEGAGTASAIIAGSIGHSSYKDEEGNLLPSIIENCYTTGSIEAKGYVGPMAGYLYYNPLILRNVYSNVTLLGNGKGSNNVCGGLVGRVRNDMNLQNSYAAGSINAPVAGGIVGGGQSSTSPAMSYTNVIAWNSVVEGTNASPFGTTTESDILSECYCFDEMLLNGEKITEETCPESLGRKSHEELQKLAASWGNPWYSDSKAGNGYPILQWQYDRGDYRLMCGFPYEDRISSAHATQERENALYDLSGRPLYSVSRDGLYIELKNGQARKILHSN